MILRFHKTKTAGRRARYNRSPRRIGETVQAGLSFRYCIAGSGNRRIGETGLTKESSVAMGIRRAVMETGMGTKDPVSARAQAQPACEVIPLSLPKDKSADAARLNFLARD